jgi:hypothetical protein
MSESCVDSGICEVKPATSLPTFPNIHLKPAADGNLPQEGYSDTIQRSSLGFQVVDSMCFCLTASRRRLTVSD